LYQHLTWLPASGRPDGLEKATYLLEALGASVFRTLVGLTALAALVFWASLAGPPVEAGVGRARMAQLSIAFVVALYSTAAFFAAEVIRQQL
jgi:hypothetical protein